MLFQAFHPRYLFPYVLNGAGDTTNKSLPEKYIDLHRKLCTAYYKHIVGSKRIDCKSSTALLALQILHASIKDPGIERIGFMDNFCTGHQLGEVVKIITDGKTKIAGTQKCNLIDATNRVYVKNLCQWLTNLKEDHGH